MARRWPTLTAVRCEALEIAEAKAIVRQEGRDVRRRAGLSQADIARQLGVHEATVSRWERGARSPSSAAARQYAELLRQLGEMLT
jgi:DNA-binding transcriptional regulator YiaG